MARTHARTKGKSGSSRPVKNDLSFVTLKKEEVEKIIVDLANSDNTASKIGIILRDTYGVPSVKALCGKSITEIMSEQSVATAIPEDLQALVARVKALKKHLEFNPRDTHNKRGLILNESKIRRLSGYYKKTGKIPANWTMN